MRRHPGLDTNKQDGGRYTRSPQASSVTSWSKHSDSTNRSYGATRASTLPTSAIVPPSSFWTLTALSLSRPSPASIAVAFSLRGRECISACPSMEAVQLPPYLPAYETRLHVKDARQGPKEITELAQKQPCDSRHAAHIQLRKHCQVPSLAGDRAGNRHENDVNPGSRLC
jgi:hypothetical protein